MRVKKFAFLILAFLIFSCSSNQPPVPPPQPVPGPVNPPPPQTQPNPHPNPHPTPEPKPVLRDHTRMISYGVLTILAQSNVDMKAFFDGLPKQVNFVRVFGLNGWNNYEGFYPWPNLGAGYNLAKANPKYYGQLDSMIEQASLHDVGIEFVYLTGYLSSGKWGKYQGYGAKNTPFCFGNVQTWCNDSATLFNNWNHQNVQSSVNFSWLFWKADAKDNVLSVQGTGKLGPPLISYVRNVADRFAYWKGKYKNLRVFIEPINEPFVTVDSSGNTIDAKSEADVRIENWIDSEYKKRGFIPSESYRIVNNDGVIPDSDPRGIYLPDIKRNQKFLQARGKLYEIHGCDSARAAQLQAAGLPMAWVVCETDGVNPDDRISGEAKALLKSLYVKRFGIKQPDTWTQPAYNPRNINYNLKDSMPELKAVFQ